MRRKRCTVAIVYPCLQDRVVSGLPSGVDGLASAACSGLASAPHQQRPVVELPQWRWDACLPWLPVPLGGGVFWSAIIFSMGP